MNIIAVSMVKNEEDIIELFCRYTLGFSDKLLLIEDNSDDRTPEILGSLIEEGLDIVLAENSFSLGFYSCDKVNGLIKKAFEEYEADLVVPLDADEFVTTDTGNCVRGILEGLRSDIRYLFPWRTYVLTEEASSSGGSVFERFDRYRPPELEEWHKLTVSRELFMNDGYRIGLGKHELEPSPESPEREEVVSGDLLFAHFPIRGIGQASGKIIIGWLNYMCMPDTMRKSGHWPIMYDSIKNEGRLTAKQAEHHSFYYSVFSKDVDKSGGDFSARLIHMPIDTDPVAEKSKLMLKYTPEQDGDYLRIGLLLPHIEKMIAAFKVERDEYEWEISYLVRMVNMLRKENEETVSAVAAETERTLKESNTWRAGRIVTAPMRLIKKALSRN